MLKKILLLNPPVFNKKRFIRSGYCNSVSKGGYYWPPIDLLAQSGILKTNFDITIIDATAENFSSADTLNILSKISKNFDGLFFISSLASKNFDFQFISELKQKIKINKTLVSAGFLLFDNSEVLQNNLADGVLLDYTSKETIDFFSGEKRDFDFISTNENIHTILSVNNLQSKNFDYPTPLHTKFPLKKYYMPNCKRLPMTNIITNLGCPFKCGFCTWSNLKYRQRSINNVIDELKYLNQNKIFEIMFIDPTFGADKNHAMDLLNAIIKSEIIISFSIECRVDLITDKFVDLLKKAGCHSITFGLESGNDEILERIKKNFKTSDIRRAFEINLQDILLSGFLEKHGTL